MRKKIAIVRGKFLNKYDMQSYEPLAKQYDITAFGSQTAFHGSFSFPTIKLFSPLDMPEFPYKWQILNRTFTDAHYLFGLENSLQGFDIVHTAETYFHFTQQCLNAKKKGYVKKVVVTVWENIPFNNEGIRGRADFKKKVFQEADHFIAVSERAKAALVLEGADEEKISIVSPGIDTTLFSPKERSQAKNITLLFVGRLVKNKGVYELLYGLKQVSLLKYNKDFGLKLVIIGSGPEKENLKLLAKKMQIDQMITYKELPYGLMKKEYGKADIFIAPSKEDSYWQEQWGMALMEAQASGLPIVTTMSGSIHENVGDAAMLVQPGDVVSLTNGIIMLLRSSKLRLAYSEKARERAISIHDIQVTAKKIGEVYEKILR